MHGDRNFDRGLGSRPEAARERQRSLPEAEMAPLGGDFSAKVAQANDRIICGSSVDAVKTLPMGRILARRLRIPFFRRRYCWSEPQWASKALSSSASAEKASSKEAGAIRGLAVAKRARAGVAWRE